MTNTNTSTLGSNTLYLTISKFLTLFISLISNMILSRSRTLAEYGTYSQLIMVSNLVIPFFLLGLPNSVNYFLSQDKYKNEKEKFLSLFYSFCSLLSIVVGFLFALFTWRIAYFFKNPLINNYVYFLVLYPWTRIITSSIENVLVIHNRTKTLAYYKVSNSLLLFIIVFITFLFNFTFSQYLFFYLTVELIFTITVYILIKKMYSKIKFYLDSVMLKEVLSFSIPIGVATMVGSLNYNIDQLMIGSFYNTEMLAIYSNAGRELPISIFSISIVTIVLPKIISLYQESSYEKLINLWKSSIIVSYIILSLFSFGIFIFAKDVLVFLYSDKYTIGINVFRVYTIVLLLRVTYFGSILNASGKTKFILYSSIFSLMLNVILNYILLNLYGFIGPAIATLVSQSVINLIQLFYSARLLKTKLSSIFPWGKILQISLINLILGVIFFQVKQQLFFESLIGNFGESIILGAIWSIVYYFLIKYDFKENWLIFNRGGFHD